MIDLEKRPEEVMGVTLILRIGGQQLAATLDNEALSTIAAALPVAVTRICGC
jgi:hypothetical protein